MSTAVNSKPHVATPEQVVRELRHLPSAPKVLPRLKRLLSDVNSSMSEIVELIRLDPGISAKVLQTANSAYYSKGARCSHVDEAVNRVGYDQVYELVAYTVASQVLVRPLESYRIEPDQLWLAAVSCALAAEKLAEMTGQERDIAYTVGLLHGVGMIAIDDWVMRHHAGVQLSSHGLPREACENERNLLGFTQAEAGAALLRHWDFPHSMSEPVRWQYFPRSTAGHQRMACLLLAAKWVRSTICTSPSATAPAMPDPWLLQPLRVNTTQLENCAADVQSQLASISSLLDASAGKVDKVEFPGGSREFHHDSVRPA